MHAALVKLMMLQGRGVLRRAVRGAKRPRGAILFALGLFMSVFWLVPSLFQGNMTPRSPAGMVREIVAVGLFGFCLIAVVTSGTSAVTFSASEVDFLFPGPFTRRELLGYKIAKQSVGALFNALLFSVVFLQHMQRWLAGFAGIFLALMLIQLFSLSLVLIGQTVAARAYTRGRKVALGVVAALVVVGLAQAAAGGAEEGTLELLRRFRASWAGTCLLAPFEVFARTITAESLYPQLAGWGGLAAAIDGILVVAVMRLDADYLEASAVASQRLYERRQRARRGGAMMSLGSRGAARLHVPQLPWLGGAGPIAWRQIVSAVRGLGGFMVLAAVFALGAGASFLARTKGGEGPGIAGMIGVWLLILFPQFFRFDFRGDLDHMEWLKMLPLGSTAVALGELAAPVVALTLVQAILVGCFAVFAHVTPIVLVGAAMVALPLSLLLFGMENLIFLLFPSRAAASSPGDLQFIGRQMVVMIVKMLLLVACGGAAALGGFVAYRLSGGSWAAAVAVAWVILALPAAATVPAVAWAFRRFDVSSDMPA